MSVGARVSKGFIFKVKRSLTVVLLTLGALKRYAQGDADTARRAHFNHEAGRRKAAVGEGNRNIFRVERVPEPPLYSKPPLTHTSPRPYRKRLLVMSFESCAPAVKV